MKKIIILLLLVIIAFLAKFMFFNKPAHSKNIQNVVNVAEGFEKPHIIYYKNNAKAVVKGKINVYYNNKEQEVGKLNTDTKTGTKVAFYKDSTDAYVSIKLISEYKNDTLLNQKYYNKKEELIAEGTFKNRKPHTGKFYQQICNLYSIKKYDSGKIIEAITFNLKNKAIATLHYKNEKPFFGTVYSCSEVRNYKNGKLNGKLTSYFDDFYEHPEYIVNYKQGKIYGNYIVYDSDEVFVKLHYNNDTLQGNQFLYNNAEGYFYKINIDKSDKHNFISEIKKITKDSNKLLREYSFETTTNDEFTFFIDPKTINILEEDINQDGHTDITINNQFYNKQHSYYYLYNSLTQKFVLIPQFTAAQNLQLIDKTKIAVFKNDYIDDESRISTKTVYDISNINKLQKIKVVENISLKEKDTTITTQLYPVDYNKYPLLDKTLPPVTLIQGSKQVNIKSEEQEITLKKEMPFSISFVGDVNKQHYSEHFFIKVYVTLKKEDLDEVTEGVIQEDISFLSRGTSMAINNNAFAITEDGHNIWIYEEGVKYNNIKREEKIKENIYKFSHMVDTIPHYKNTKTIDLLRNNLDDKPIYVLFFIDKNRNQRLDKNEFFKVKITFK